MTHPLAAYLARCALHARALYPGAAPIAFGHITLLPHQVTAVHWLEHRIIRFGGALLADPPGLGKTYVALAIAARRKVTPLVIAPAGLRRRWHDAAIAANTAIDFISTERLSAPAAIPTSAHDFIIIDEAHHLRTASTRRYQRTATLCATANVLLLTATPIHNHPQDLERITALFHLPITRQTPATLRRLTLRRTLTQIHAAGLTDGAPLSIPTVCLRVTRAQTPRTDQITTDILHLPPIDDTSPDGHRLLQLGLFHTLRSSDAACRAQVRNRIAATIALQEAARADVEPSAAIRRAFSARDGDVQMAMTELLGTASTGSRSDLAQRAACQRDALRALLPRLDGDADRRRATALRRLARWCCHPVVAFTQFTATAEFFYQQLRQQPGIALLSGTRARIASGVVSRSDVINRLLSSDRVHHRAVRLLVTTDVLSEGLSLAGVATIVHLDLPWTAARIDQRIGRAARIGSPRQMVRVVTLPAQVPVDLTAHLKAILAGKRRAMRDFCERTGSDAAHVLLLRQLATASAPSDSIRCVTLCSSEVRHERVIALVRLRGRRTLLVSEQGRLRAPATADWHALLHASSTHERRSTLQHLRAALRVHQAERELCDVAHHVGDLRLHARRLLDDRLLARDHVSRIAAASEASRARADVMRPTRAAAVATEEGLRSAARAVRTVNRHHASSGVEHRVERRACSLRAAVVLLPA